MSVFRGFNITQSLRSIVTIKIDDDHVFVCLRRQYIITLNISRAHEKGSSFTTLIDIYSYFTSKFCNRFKHENNKPQDRQTLNVTLTTMGRSGQTGLTHERFFRKT